MFSYLLFMPVLIYLAAALIVPRLRFWVNKDGRTLAFLISSVLSFIAALFLIFNNDQFLSWTLSSWEGTVALGNVIQFRLDSFGQSFLLLVTVVGMAVFVGSLDEQVDVLDDDYQAGMFIVLAGVAAYGLADNLMTMFLVALLVDAGLLYAIGLAGQPRWFLVLVIHSLMAQCLMILAALFLWQDSHGTMLSTANEMVLLLLVASAVSRMGVLPFSLIPIAFEALPQRILALLPLATVGMSSVLLGRLSLAGSISDSNSLGLLAAFGIGIAGWLAWWREESSTRLMMLSAVQAGWLLWAFSWGLSTAAIASAWSGILALSVLAIHSGQVNLRNWGQIPGVVAALMLVGVPSSALWQSATRLSGEAWLREARNNTSGPVSDLFWQSVGNPSNWILVLAAIGVMGTMAALLEWLIVEVEEDPLPQYSRWIGSGLLAILTVPVLASLFGIRAPILPEATLATSPLVSQLSLLIIGWAGGFWLWRMRPELRSFYPLFDNISTIFSFIWLWRIIGRVGWLLLSGYRGMMLVLEGENYGWLLLFLFVTLIFLVQ